MGEMTFWNHLDELRYLIFRVLGVWLVIAIVFFIAMPWIFDQVMTLSQEVCK